MKGSGWALIELPDVRVEGNVSVRVLFRYIQRRRLDINAYIHITHTYIHTHIQGNGIGLK